MATSLGNCDQNVYPNITSFLFVEYNCTGQPTLPSTAALPSTVSTTVSSSTVVSSSTPGATFALPSDIISFNSSLACTRGANQTNHNLDCRNHYQDGDIRSLSIIRVFYGATPLSSGCDRTAPYVNCCVRDPNKVDCVFQNDAELQEIIEKCSGVSYCEFPGLRVSASLGNCDPNNYPALTSFSFIEYQCLPKEFTRQVCSDINDRQIGRLYLESNTVLVGKTVTNTICQCLITTDCDSSLSFYGIVVQLTQINATTCAEEITFADVRYPQLSARVNCTDDDNVLYNKSLFTSLSNVASFQFLVTGQQLGKIYIRAQSSVNTASVTLICGQSVAQTVGQIQQCPNQTFPSSATTLQYNITTPSPTATTTVQYYQSTPSSSPDITTTLQYNQTTTLSSPDITTTLQYNQTTTLSSPDITTTLQYNQSTPSSSPDITTTLQYNQTTTLSSPNTITTLQYNETTTTSSSPTSPNRNVSSTTSATTTTWYSMTSVTSTSMRSLEEATFNSTLSCTRGADLTNHNLDCRNQYQDGDNRSLAIIRVFYGATSLSRYAIK
ncbi:unnamed protein product [Candidula unifasciata]|uniref:Uncharacterized protein n=1 Tax=Candidula unifasciata TaxID=100452 RepID=A0A8S3YME0_9EUPU|nr:unnamed protein product [Candidula unifasciata]